MDTMTIRVTLGAETMKEIAELATTVSKGAANVEQMNKQVRRIAEHAGVVVSVILDELYDHVQNRLEGRDASFLKGNVAYRQLQARHNSK